MRDPKGRFVKNDAENGRIGGLALQRQIAELRRIAAQKSTTELSNVEDDASQWLYLVACLRARGWPCVTPQMILALLPKSSTR